MITIDSREQKGAELATHLANLGETEFEISDTKRVRGENENWKWPSDITVKQPGRTIGIQRKTINDFVGSVDELKQTMELGRGGDEWDLFVLLLEGVYELEGGRLSYRRGKYHPSIPISSLHGFVFSQQCRASHVYRTNSLAETARFLHWLHDYDGPIDSFESRAAQNVLQSLPGIGEQKARVLLETFGNAQVAITRVSDWRNVEGFGDKTVERCEKVLL